MSWSYNPSLLATSTKDQVRLLIGDVLLTDPQMQDEEIAYLGTTRGSVYGAAAECCRALSAKFSRSVDQQAGTSKISYSQMAKAYAAKANEFEVKATFSAMPYMGGVSITDMQLQEMNSDRVNPSFTIGMMDNFLPMASGGNETADQGNNSSLSSNP
jgi:hypothetical protein